MNGIVWTDCILLFLGYSWLRAIWPEGRRWTGLYIPLMYFLGEYSVIIWMYILGALDVPYSPITIDFPLVVIAAATYFLIRPKPKTFLDAPGPDRVPMNWICLAALAYIVFQFMYVYLKAWNVPIYEWDVVARIGIKARTIFYDHDLEKIKYICEPRYALGGPFILSWAAMHAGAWKEAVLRFIPATELVMFAALFQSFLRAFLPLTWSLLGTALLVSANYFVYFSTLLYDDFHVSVFFSSSVFLLILWKRFGYKPLLVAASLLFSAACLFKLEAFAYLFWIAVLWGWLFRDHIGNTLKYRALFSLPALAGLALHYLTCRKNEDPAVSVHYIGLHGFGGRLYDFIGSLCNELFMLWDWNVLWVAVIGVWAVQVRNRRLSPEEKSLGLLLTALFINILLAAVFTNRYPVLAGGLAYQTLPRMVLQFYPLAPALICFLAAK